MRSLGTVDGGGLGCGSLVVVWKGVWLVSLKDVYHAGDRVLSRMNQQVLRVDAVVVAACSAN